MTVYVISQGTEGPQVDVFGNVDEAIVNGESIRRPSAATILVVAS